MAIIIGSCGHEMGSWLMVQAVDSKGNKRKLALCKHCFKKIKREPLVIDGIEYKEAK